MEVHRADRDSRIRQDRSRIAKRHNGDGGLLCFANGRYNSCIRVRRHYLATCNCELAEVRVAWSGSAITRRSAGRGDRSSGTLDVAAATAGDRDEGRAGKADQCTVGNRGNTIAALQSADGDQRLISGAVRGQIDGRSTDTSTPRREQLNGNGS